MKQEQESFCAYGTLFCYLFFLTIFCLYEAFKINLSFELK